MYTRSMRRPLFRTCVWAQGTGVSDESFFEEMRMEVVLETEGFLLEYQGRFAEGHSRNGNFRLPSPNLTLSSPRPHLNIETGHGSEYPFHKPSSQDAVHQQAKEAAATVECQLLADAISAWANRASAEVGWAFCGSCSSGSI